MTQVATQRPPLLFSQCAHDCSPIHSASPGSLPVLGGILSPERRPEPPWFLEVDMSAQVGPAGAEEDWMLCSRVNLLMLLCLYMYTPFLQGGHL